MIPSETIEQEFEGVKPEDVVKGGNRSESTPNPNPDASTGEQGGAGEGGSQAPPSSESGGSEGGSPPPNGEATGEGAAPAETTIDYNAILNDLSGKIGLEVKSQDELAEAVKLGLQTKADPYSALPEDLQKLAKFRDSGGNLQQYLRWSTLDIDTMPEKDVLYEKFVSDNAKRYEKDPQLVKQRFEREFNEKYGVPQPPSDLEEDELEEWKAKNAERVEAAKSDLKWAVEDAKEFLEENKVKFTTPESNGNGEMTEEKRKELLQVHEQHVDKVFPEFKGVEIKMPEDKVFKFTPSDETRQKISTYLKNPAEYLNKVGLTDDKFDVQKMALVATLVDSIESGNLGGPLMRFIVDSYNQDFIQNQLESPAQRGQASSSGGQGELTEDQEIAKAFKDKREAEQRKRRGF